MHVDPTSRQVKTTRCWFAASAKTKTRWVAGLQVDYELKWDQVFQIGAGSLMKTQHGGRMHTNPKCRHLDHLTDSEKVAATIPWCRDCRGVVNAEIERLDV